MSPIDETVDRIAVRFVARSMLGQMRDPLKWLYRVSKRFGMHDGPGFEAIGKRIELYLDMVMLHDDAVIRAMAEKPTVLH